MRPVGLKTAFLVAFTLALLACTSGPAEFPAPDFTLKSPVTGQQVSFSELKGRPVLIYWFASW